MIVIEQCRIDHEGKHLIIEAAVDTLDYYKNVYIDSIKIDTDSTYSPNGPSNNYIYSKEFESNYINIDTRCDCNSLSVKDNCDNIYTSQKAGTKRIRLNLTAKDLNTDSLNNKIFFIYITATGIPDSYTPCGMDNHTVMGVAVNMRPIYNMAMKYIKELNSDCSVPKGLIDMILRLKVFKLALKTGNYQEAISLFKKFFNNRIDTVIGNRCKCNGTS